MNIKIQIKNKTATTENTVIVKDNSDYILVFDFNGEFEADKLKTARIIKDTEKYEDIPFTGTQVALPRISNARFISVGVFDDEVATTPAVLYCEKSILGGKNPEPPTADVYGEIIDLMNDIKSDISKIEEGKSDKDAVYTKDEVDTKLLKKVSGEDLSAAVAEVSGKMGAKADKSDVYTKEEVDSQLQEKVDINKFTPVLSAVTDVKANKVDKVEGKGLSGNDFTDEEKEKLDKVVYISIADLKADTLLLEKLPVGTTAIINLQTNSNWDLVLGKLKETGYPDGNPSSYGYLVTEKNKDYIIRMYVTSDRHVYSDSEFDVYFKVVDIITSENELFLWKYQYTKTQGEFSGAINGNLETSDIGKKYFNFNMSDPMYRIDSGCVILNDLENNVASSDMKNTQFALAIGSQTSATGSYSFAGGHGSSAEGEGAFAFGDQCTAVGDYNVAMGCVVNTFGAGSIGLGRRISATGEGVYCIGDNSSIAGNQSVLLGNNCTLEGNLNTVVGMYNITGSGIYTTNIGNHNNIQNNADYSVVIGDHNWIAAPNVFAIGSNLNINNFRDDPGSGAVFLLGNNNRTTETRDYALIFGNGCNEDYDMLTIDNDGIIKILCPDETEPVSVNDRIHFDTAPTENSKRAVTSGGVYEALQSTLGDIETALDGVIALENQLIGEVEA